MNIDLMSLLIGIFSSILAAVSVYITKKIVRKKLEQKIITLKNSSGGEIEIITENNGESNIRSSFNDAIEYEKSVADILRSLNFEVEETSLNFSDKGYDLLLRSGDRLVAVEVKSHSKPLSANVVKETLRKFPSDIDDALYISKNGFSISSIDYIKKINKSIALASGENEALAKSIKSALESKGIASQTSGRN
ncbi:restriction endonuclease [Thiohalophilus thiocyanatoxydans]|uniref:Restriction endonuclease n=1 Tax=Thiohalophilus thiocyanatoxydans TaxID=381308 RepID=A0A4R8IYJ0_9GAMM|nr:restriction endonuclease [Thiohalophilus thiocyanatoxydans]TDY03007.1 restriction endonuclease [Thiohalophilus thiocyanatoxydans]